MSIIIREIDKHNADELDIVVRRCMAAVLETIPEFEGQESLARKHLPNFTYAQMSDMIRNDLDDATKRIMVATVDNVVAGQALYSVKHDDEGNIYGFCFSRYVAPEYRRMGIAGALLEDAIDWFKANDAMYVIAQTHVTNVALQNLFGKYGFAISEPQSGIWQYYILRRELRGDEMH